MLLSTTIVPFQAPILVMKKMGLVVLGRRSIRTTMNGQMPEEDGPRRTRQTFDQNRDERTDGSRSTRQAFDQNHDERADV